MGSSGTISGINFALSISEVEFEAKLDKSGKKAQLFSAQVQREFDKITGKKATDQAFAFAAAFEKAGGSAKLSGQQMDLVRAKVEKLAAAGAKLPAALQGLGAGKGSGFAQVSNEIQKMSQTLSGQLTARTGAFGSALAALGPVGLAAAAGVAVAAGGAAAFGEAVVSLTNYGDRLDELHARTGVAVEAIQALEPAAKTSGVQLEDVAQGINKMQKAMVEGSTVFKRLGMDVQALKALAPDQQFLAIADAIRQLPDPMQRTAASTEAFGKGAAVLLPLIMADARSLTAQWKEMGFVIGDKPIKAAAELKDKTDLLGLAWDKTKMQIASAAVESGVLQQAADAATEALSGTASAAQKSGSMRDLFAGIVPGVRAANAAIVETGRALGPLGGLMKLAWDYSPVGLFVSYTEKAIRYLGDLSGVVRDITIAKGSEQRAAMQLVANDALRLAKILKDAMGGPKEGGGSGKPFITEEQRKAAEDAATKANDAARTLSASLRGMMDSTAQAIGASAGTLDGKLDEIGAKGVEMLARVSDAVAKARAAGAPIDAGKVDAATAAIQRMVAALEKQAQKTHAQKIDEAMQRGNREAEKEGADARKAAIDSDREQAESLKKVASALKDRWKKEYDGYAATRSLSLQYMEVQALEKDNLGSIIAVMRAKLNADMEDVQAKIRLGEITEEQGAKQLALLAKIEVAQEQAAAKESQAQTYREIGDALAFAADQALRLAEALGLSDQQAQVLDNTAKGVAAAFQQDWGTVIQTTVSNLIIGIESLTKSTFNLQEIIHTFDGTDIQGFLTISDELEQKIGEMADELGVSVHYATLLSMTDVLAESGRSVAEVGPQVMELYAAMAQGLVPVQEGQEELNKLWQQAREEASQVGDAVTVAMLKAAEATGTLSKEQKAFISEQNKKMGGGASLIAEGLSQMDLKGLEGFGANAAHFFEKGWEATIAEKGLMGALEELGPKAQELFDQMTAAGNEAGAKMLAPIAELQAKIGDNQQLSGMLKTLEGMGQVLEGSANKGVFNAEDQKAFGESMASARDALKTAGVDEETSIRAIMPQLSAAIQASQQMGVPLDAKTAELKKAAEDMGFTFPVEPMTQLVDLMKTFVQGMGFDLPASVTQASQSTRTLTEDVGAAAAQTLATTSATMSEAMVSLGEHADAATSTTMDSFRTLADVGEETTSYWSTQVNGALLEMGVFAQKGTGDAAVAFQSFSDLVTDESGPLGGARAGIRKVAEEWNKVTSATEAAAAAARAYPIPGGGPGGPGPGERDRDRGHALGGLVDFPAAGARTTLHGFEAIVPLHRDLTPKGPLPFRAGGGSRVYQITVPGAGDPRAVAAHVMAEIDRRDRNNSGGRATRIRRIASGREG